MGEIKWEKSQEFGGAVIGNLGDYGHKAKWTFAAKTASSMPLGDRYFFNMGNSAINVIHPPKGNWLPVSTQNTNVTGGVCTGLGTMPNISVYTYTGQWYLSKASRNCSYTCEVVH